MTDAPRPDTTGTGGTARKSLAFCGPGMDDGTGTGGTGTAREYEAVPVVPAAVAGPGPENGNAFNAVPVVPVVPAQRGSDGGGLLAAMAALFPRSAAVMPADLDAFAERAAIAEHDGGLTRPAAERLAAREQGFADAAALRAAAVELWSWRLDGLAAHETSPRGRACIRDAQRFVAGGWAAQAAALGWSEVELFGLCPVAHWARPDRMGAAWLGGDVAAVTAECVTLASGLRVWRASRANGLRVPW